MKKIVILTVLNFIIFNTFLFANNDFIFPPSLGCILGGTVKLNGKLINDNESDNLTIIIKTADGKEYKDSNGLKNNNYSITTISGFGETAEITVFYNGKKYYIIEPINGKFNICEKTGEIKSQNIVISEISPWQSYQISHKIENNINSGKEIKGKKFIGDIKGDVEIPNNIVNPETISTESIVKKLPKLEKVTIESNQGKLKIEKAVLKEATFNINKNDKIEFGKGVIFDKTSIKNLSEKIEKPVSIKNVLPEVKINTKNITLNVKLPMADFPIMVDENNNYKSPVDILNDTMKQFNINTKTNIGVLRFTFLTKKLFVSAAISDIKIGRTLNLFSEEESSNVEVLKDGEFLVKQGDINFLLAPMPYNFEEFDSIFSKVKEDNSGFTIEIMDRGLLKADWLGENREKFHAILCFNGVIYNDNQTNENGLLYDSDNISKIKVSYSDGKYEYLTRFFIGFDYIGKWLDKKVSNWKFDRIKGILILPTSEEEIKVIPDMFFRDLTDKEKSELSNTEDNVTFKKENNDWYILTPDGAQKFYFLKQ